MSTTTVSSPYYSLAPADTFIWRQGDKCCCVGKLALGVVAVIAVPLELLGRLFANLAIAGHRLFHTEAQQSPIKATRTVQVSELVEQLKKQNLLIEIPLTKSMTQDVCVLKMRGTFYGQALGDAFGLVTEFSSKEALLKYKPQKLEFSDLLSISKHRFNMFAERGWTDDTDQMIAIARAEIEVLLDPSKSKEIRMAEHLRNWQRHGLNHFSSLPEAAFISRADPESTDSLRRKITCQDIGAMTSAVVGRTDFLKDPYAAALAVWKQDNGPIQLRPAANGAIMRTSVLGSIYRNDLNKAKEEAIRYAKVTHVDPRSIACAVALTIAIAMLHTGATLDDAMQQAEETAVQALWSEVEALQSHMIKKESAKWKKIAQKFKGELRTCMHASLNDFALCTHPIGYTFKCLGAAFYSAREAQRLINEGTTPEAAFRTVLETIIFEGGDADTNAAAAGALLGAYLGEEAIPESWRKGLHPQDKRVLEETLRHVEALANRSS